MKNVSFRHTIRQGLSGLFHICKEELKKSVKDEGVLIFFLLVPLAYPLLYAFIYTNEVVREVPAVVVDADHSAQSREYLRLVDGSPDIRIVSHCADMEEARLLLKKQKAYGIVYIPESFSHDLASGRQTHVSIFSDMSGMLYYKALLLANTEASLHMNKEIQIRRAGNTTERQDEITTRPIAYEDISLYNPQDGFASFLIPAVLVLIIQQTLLLGIGLSAGTARENNRFRHLVPPGRHYRGTLRVVLGKSAAYLLVYAVMATYILCLVPKMFRLVRLADPGTLAAFVLPFLLACIFFAMTCSCLIRRREDCMMIFVFTSLPLLFISGISWPGSAVPPFWKAVSWLFPSTFGINGYIRVQTMGASLAEVLTEYRALWIQTGVYFLTTCLLYRRQIILSRKHALERLREYQKKNRNRRATQSATLIRQD